MASRIHFSDAFSPAVGLAPEHLGAAVGVADGEGLVPGSGVLQHDGIIHDFPFGRESIVED